MKIIDKILKEQAQKDFDEILEQNTDFKDSLLLKVSENERRERRVKYTKRFAYISLSFVVVAVIALAVSLSVFLNKDNSLYSGIQETRTEY